MVSSAQSIDPLSPAEWQTRQQDNEDEWSRWPVRRVAQLEQAIRQVEGQLSQLPDQYPVMLQNRLGFHSALEANASDAGERVHQIDFALGTRYNIGAIGIAPAANPSEAGPLAYGFPPRFKIEAQTKSGEFAVIAN